MTVKTMNNREYRHAEIDAASANELLISGYAAVFNQETVLYECDGIKYKEIIEQGAFDQADLSDVPFKYNHSDSFLVLARTRNNTLQLTIDEKGLKISANLANTQQGKDLYKLIERRDIDKMSFGFIVAEDYYERETRTRRIIKIKRVYDVSAVDIPAYDGTSINITSRQFGQEADYFKNLLVEEEKAAKNLWKRKLILQTY